MTTTFSRKQIIFFLIFIIFFIFCCDINKCQAQQRQQIMPHVMFMIDTDGRMEFKNNCTCTTTDCTECLPVCTNRTNRVNERNLWIDLVDTMTGDYTSTNVYTCNELNRPNRNAPDANYIYPHYVNTTNGTKNQNGILDTYGNQLRFGLMTSDTIHTIYNYSNKYQSSFNSLELVSLMNWQGDFSYGPLNSFTFASDINQTVYNFNLGVKNESATGFGRLIPLGSNNSTSTSIANAIDSELSIMRPYGNSSIAAMIHDYEYYLSNHPDITTNDTNKDCRQQYAILIVEENALKNSIDGGIDIINRSGCNNMNCPYQTAIEQVASLYNNQTIDKFYVIAYGSNIMNNLNYVDHANDIAMQGGTNTAYYASEANSLKSTITMILNEIINESNSNNVSTMHSRTRPALNTYILENETTYVQAKYEAGYNVTSTGPYDGILIRNRTQCSTSTTNSIPTRQTITTEDNFHDTLNNRIEERILYTVLPTDPNNTKTYLLGAETEMIPPIGTSISSNGNNNGNQQHGQGGSSCRATNSGGGGGGNNNRTTTVIEPTEEDLELVEFNSSNVTPEHLGLTTLFSTTSQRNAERTRIVDWIHGENNRRGTSSRLGSIYHSSPIVVGAPEMNIPDESYNLFRTKPEIANRPSVLYVGSNDGILHAFSTHKQIINYTHSKTGTLIQRTLEAGEELWGFIPPYVLSSLHNATKSHTWTVDGTPYVREIFYRRLPGQEPNEDLYHTIMILPLGKGGGAYIALDISDPFNPIFLWQFASEQQIGQTLGAPALLQVLININGHLEERAMTMLPGGYKPPIDPQTCELYVDGDAWNRPLGCPANGIGTPPLNGGTQNAVDHHQCWGTDGRQVYFVDPATGELVQQFGDTVFNAPMTGGVGIYSGSIGSITTRAFMSDADGYLWRFDISDTNPTNWSAVQFADMFLELHTTYPNIGQPAYNPPLISTDVEGNLVVLQGTGNPDILENGTAPNMVVSYTELLDFNLNSNNPTVSNKTNWELQLSFGEQVTGPLELFNEQVFFTSYDSNLNNNNNSSSSSSSCNNSSFGKIWGVDYIASVNNQNKLPIPRLSVNGSYSYSTSYSNYLMFGLSLTQELTCTTGSIQNQYDPFTNINQNSYNMSNVSRQRFILNTNSFTNINGQTNNTNNNIVLNPPESQTSIFGISYRAD